MPKARISAAMLTPRDRAHAADRRGLPFQNRSEGSEKRLESGVSPRPRGPRSVNFPVFSLYIREFGAETGSLSPARTAM